MSTRSERERQEAENALRIVAEELSAESGTSFFQTLALRLSDLLHADFALIGELSPDGQSVTALAFATPAGIGDTFVYPLAGTPCAGIVQSGLCIHRDSVAQLFPNDAELREMRAHAYVGVPLRNTEGKTIGLIAALWRRPLAPDEHPEHIMRIFAARSTAELTRHRTETELQLTRFSLEAATDGLFWVTPDARFVDVNNAACELLGYPREELLAMGIADVDAQYGVGEWPRFFQSLRRSGSITFESVLRHSSGRQIPVEVVAGHVRIGTRELNCSFVRDISERKRARQELIQLNEELEERVRQRTEELLAAKEEAERANRSKSEFLSSMSHELRTPLNAILGFAQLLKSDPLDPLTPNQGESVDEILRGGRHLLALINEVLDLARIESGRLELSPETITIAALFDECLALVRPEAEARDIRLEVRTPATLTVQADRLRLRQVLLNLLSNAIKYNRQGGTVLLDGQQESAQLVLVVQDTGIGIAPEFMQRLFLPFERDKAMHRGIEGTGIGLALSRRIVDAMGGTIAAHSTLGVGSLFRIRLPGVAPVAAPPADASRQ